MVAAAAVATILGLTSVHANGATQSRTAAQHLDSMVLQQLTGRPDSIPVETIVPVLGPDYTSVDTITQPRPCPPDATRAERRACRAERFALGIDSLVGTRSIAFYPTTMQAEPRGMLRMIYPAYFYVYVSPADVEVHMPVERGVSQYVTMLNFDADGVRGYSAKKVLSQWVITFSVGTPGDSYDFVM